MPLGTSATTTFTVQNTGGSGSLDISGVAVSGADFLVVGDACTGASLANLLDFCDIEVMFSPTAESSAVGTLTVTTNATNGTQKIASLIGSSPAAGTLQFSAGNYEFSGNIGTATLLVTRTGGSSGAVTVNYTTADGTASQAGDYVATSSPPNPPLTWADGDASPKTISITINALAFATQEKMFSAILSGPGGGANLGQNSLANILILATGSGGGVSPGEGGTTTDTDMGGSCSLGKATDPLNLSGPLSLFLVTLTFFALRRLRKS